MTNATISNENRIFTAALLAEPQDACRMLARALGIEDCDTADIDIPDRREWMRASTGRRLQLLAEWMHAAAYVLVDRASKPVESHRPTDFSLRTND
jgi:hypothetical protein